MADNNRLLTALKSFTCKSPIFPNFSHTILRIHQKATIGDALKKMIEFKIYALPVVDEITRKPLYVISLMNIIQYFLEQHKADFVHKIIYFLQGQEIASVPLTELEQKTDYTLDDALNISASESLYEAVKLIISRKTHRVLVTDDSGNLDNLITASRVLEFIGGMINSIPECKSTLKELGLGSSNEVFSIKDSEPAWNAFQLMVEKRVLAVAVVDNHNKLVGVVSAADFKLVGSDLKYWELLRLPTNEYLKQLTAHSTALRSQMFGWLKDGNSTAVLKVKPTSTLYLAIKLLTSYSVHRVFVVDDEDHPVGVVSINDILAVIVPQ